MRCTVEETHVCQVLIFILVFIENIPKRILSFIVWKMWLLPLFDGIQTSVMWCFKLIIL